MVRPTNLYQLFVNSAQFYSESAALIYYYENQWVEISYEVLCQKIDYFSGFLSDKGVQKGDRIGLYMENRPEWVIADMAAYRLGAVVVPIYPTLSEQEVAYIVNDSEMKLLILDSQLRFNIAVKLFNCSLLKYIVNVGSIAHDNATYIYSFVDVCAQKLVTQQCDVDLNDLASIVYTSGTTGEQKGVMLTHGNFLANVTDILSVYDLSSADKALSFLPLSHVFERTAGYYTLIAKGVTICYAQSHLTVAQDLQTIKPTVIVSVPRLYEKIYAKIMTQTVGLKKQLLDWAVAVGQNNGIRSWVANQLVFKKILAKTGGKLRFCVSGGAPLAGHLCSFFDAIGLLILEGYGLTETSPVVACNAESDYKFGTVGQPLPTVSLRVAEDGELIVYGPNVMKGYWKKEAETKQVIADDGGFMTGDLVKIDHEGYVSIVGRKKHLIVLSNGKNIAPNYIESVLLKSNFIDQVMVVGDCRKFLSALIVPNWELDQLKSYDSAMMMTLIQSELDSYQLSLSNYERVKKFTIVNDPFTQDSGELTPTLKLKRDIILQKHGHLIELMYND